MAVHAKRMSKFKSQKQGVDSAIKLFEELKSDLIAVKAAMTARAATLDKASNEGKAPADAALRAGLQLIVSEFKDYLEQFKQEPQSQAGPQHLPLHRAPNLIERGDPWEPDGDSDAVHVSAARHHYLRQQLLLRQSCGHGYDRILCDHALPARMPTCLRVVGHQ